MPVAERNPNRAPRLLRVVAGYFGSVVISGMAMGGRNLRVPLTSDSDRKVPADLGQESQASSWVEAWNSACLSRCSWGDRPLVERYLEPGGLFPTMHVRASGSYQEGTGKSGSYGMWNHPRGHVWNVFVRPASS